MAHSLARFAVALAAMVLLTVGCGSAELELDTPASAASPVVDAATAQAEALAEQPASSFEEPADNEPADVIFGDSFPEVLAVDAGRGEGTSWAFSVTLSSPYDTPERYADAWRVLDADDTELGIRILGHDHANEQPFTRSTTVEIPDGTGTVWVEGRDQANGWSGQRFEVQLASG